jgi:hypothetical protein
MDKASDLFATLFLFATMLGPPAATDRTPAEGAYERLAPGSQRIARALYEVQAIHTTPAGPAPTSAGRAPVARLLTLDEIAARRQGAEGWDHVFRDMRGTGLVRATSLDEVVSRYRLREERRLQ